jgi:hypothetical protein
MLLNNLIGSKEMSYQSWRDPQNEIIDNTNIYVLTVSEDDQSLIDFISNGYFVVNYDSPESISALLFRMGNKWLNEALYNLADNFRHDDLLNKKRIKIFLINIYYQIDESKYTLLVSFENPAVSSSNYLLGITNIANQINDSYLTEMALWKERIEKERKESDELVEKHPKLKEVTDKFAGLKAMGEHFTEPRLLPDYEFNSKLHLSKVLAFDEVKSLDLTDPLATISSSLFAPRSGVFKTHLALDGDGGHIAVITWEDYRDSRVSYLEVIHLIHSNKQKFTKLPLSTAIADLEIEFDDEVSIVSEVGFPNASSENNDHILNGVELYFNDSDIVISETKNLIKEKGFEAFAWYQPHHFYSRSRWGIYFDAEKMDKLAFTLAQDLRPLSIKENIYSYASKLAMNLVYQHELFHAKVEAIITWLELSAQNKKFIKYFENVYKKSFLKDCCIEEALANWNSWMFDIRSIGELDAYHFQRVKSIVEDFLDSSPPGYDQWAIGKTVESWNTLGSQIASGELTKHKNDLPLGVIFNETYFQFHFLPSDIPIYFIGSGQILSRLISAPSTLRLPPRRELRKVIEKFYGYSLDPKGGKGSHEKWIGDNGRFFIIPGTDPVSPPVFKTFLHHFGIDKQTYINNIRSNF